MLRDENVEILLRDFSAIIASATTEQLYILDEVQQIIDQRRTELNEELNENASEEDSTSEESTDNQDSGQEASEPVSEQEEASGEG